MIQYKCDKCRKVFSDESVLFKVNIKKPEVWSWSDEMIYYCTGDLHLCTDCMSKVIECLNEN